MEAQTIADIRSDIIKCRDELKELRAKPLTDPRTLQRLDVAAASLNHAQKALNLIICEM